ncbi:hypothetical protein SLEP1_g47635 [Rubroshorea leprosula]|uniref:Uncharacterized protein n=1 Tax=Rubroshorea leprosula TaxID=152421 RepID=A0AAV5LTZ4_9ROSI|nr:hypothetical protein SLEP1_g47635 [Rubroshorea leprosula]
MAKSFSLHKRSGKKCYLLAARDLAITWGDTPRYWSWNSIQDSRFLSLSELHTRFQLTHTHMQTPHRKCRQKGCMTQFHSHPTKRIQACS